MSNDTSDNYVEMWKKLIQNLEAARGNGTSMISLIIKPGDQINKVAKMLEGEYGTASNIKSRVNRLSVLRAITLTQRRLKLYNRLPGNGLVVYCGTIITEEGKEKKVNIYFEPFRPLNTSLYLCDNKFHTEALSALLEDNSKFGFIVVDGNEALFGTLAGNTCEVLHKVCVDLPKKHGGGCQPALSFAHLRTENGHNYVRKVSETAVQLFITDDKVNVEGLVMAGSADFKNELCQFDMFDQRLQAKVLLRVDVSYGADQGFNQTIKLSADCLTHEKFIQEQKIIKSCIDEINQVCSNTNQILNLFKAQLESDALRSAHAKEEPIIKAAPVANAVMEEEVTRKRRPEPVLSNPKKNKPKRENYYQESIRRDILDATLANRKNIKAHTKNDQNIKAENVYQVKNPNYQDNFHPIINNLGNNNEFGPLQEPLYEPFDGTFEMKKEAYDDAATRRVKQIYDTQKHNKSIGVTLGDITNTKDSDSLLDLNSTEQTNNNNINENNDNSSVQESINDNADIDLTRFNPDLVTIDNEDALFEKQVEIERVVERLIDKDNVLMAVTDTTVVDGAEVTRQLLALHPNVNLQ